MLLAAGGTDVCLAEQRVDGSKPREPVGFSTRQAVLEMADTGNDAAIRDSTTIRDVQFTVTAARLGPARGCGTFSRPGSR